MSQRVPILLLAKVCGIPARTLRRWAAEGRITSERRGREWLIDPLELAQLQDIRDDSAGRLPRTA